jgi:uncharacterized membrane protein
VTTQKPSTLKRIGDALNTGDDKGVMIAVAVSLIIIIGVVAGYYVYHVREKPEGYSEIYVLDAQGQAVNYPFNFTVNQNVTFNVYAVNHMGDTESFQVQEKITSDPVPQLPASVTPANTYSNTLADGETWPIQVPVTISNAGTYTIYFELWRQISGSYAYTGNAAVVHVNVSQP